MSWEAEGKSVQRSLAVSSAVRAATSAGMGYGPYDTTESNKIRMKNATSLARIVGFSSLFLKSSACEVFRGRP
jgi:hypothetical protein